MHTTFTKEQIIKIGYVAAIVAASAAALFFLGRYGYRRYQISRPIMQQLEQSSLPVTKTPEEQLSDIRALNAMRVLQAKDKTTILKKAAKKKKKHGTS